ncbi:MULTISPECIES: hypothetical protein [Streptomyces]|uniref:hypothetical protein n=1 Tax=Streptomyces TaxID=1883 RepID=UPI000562F1FE|nr:MULTISPECIES: hypothetical protein [Streptomyces]AKL68172.1 hypothetical protein M444_25180 [Streptomyces sp. Mg1]WBY22395.1 hypothetical protein PET44_23850 [Streptomyces goshikiensis]
MPWTQTLRPSRRSLLTGAAGVAGGALLAGCSDGSGSSDADTGVPLERRMREAAVRDSERLLERYDATAAAHPDLAARLAPLRGAVAEHTGALAVAGPVKTGPSASPSASGSRSGASPSPSASAPAGADAAPSAAAVPAKPAEALTALADAERSLAEARTVALAGAPGELARLLASVAACGAVHAYLLTSTPGAAS